MVYYVSLGLLVGVFAVSNVCIAWVLYLLYIEAREFNHVVLEVCPVDISRWAEKQSLSGGLSTDRRNTGYIGNLPRGVLLHSRNCATVEHRCSTHQSQRSPLSRRAVFSYGLAKASRVASELYKTRLGESRGPVLLSGVEVPGSKCLNNALEPSQQVKSVNRGRWYA